MGMLKKALEPVSSYSAKGKDQWQQLMDELTDCVLPAQIDAFEERFEARPLDVPGPWHEPLREKIAGQREYIASENITEIIRDRFNF